MNEKAPAALTRSPPATASHNPVKPRPAASMVIVDNSRPETKVLLGRRHSALAFLPGKYVFPGGRLEAADRWVVAAGTLSDHCFAKLARRRPQRFPSPHAFALAAIRETFEETGLIIGTPRNEAQRTAAPAAWRRFIDDDFAPDLTRLRFIARAVTPPSFVRRYDTSFFLADVSAVAHRIEGCVGEDSELVELVWLSFAEAIKCDVPKVTALILRELEMRLTAKSADLFPVPFFYERQRRWIREEL